MSSAQGELERLREEITEWERLHASEVERADAAARENERLRQALSVVRNVANGALS